MMTAAEFVECHLMPAALTALFPVMIVPPYGVSVTMRFTCIV